MQVEFVGYMKAHCGSWTRTDEFSDRLLFSVIYDKQEKPVYFIFFAGLFTCVLVHKYSGEYFKVGRDVSHPGWVLYDDKHEFKMVEGLIKEYLCGIVS